MWCSRQSG